MFSWPNGKALNEDTCPVVVAEVNFFGGHFLTVIDAVLDERIYGRPKLVMRGVYFFSFKAPCLLKIASKAEKCTTVQVLCKSAH